MRPIRRIAFHRGASHLKAFLAAARSGNLGVMQLLVRLGASVEATDDDGATALHLAAAGGHLDVVGYLVEELGLDVAATNDDGDTALGLAAAEGHTAVVAYLEPLAAAEEPVEPARTPEEEEARAALDSLGIEYAEETFHAAAEAGNLEVVKLFVEAGIDIDATNNYGSTALHVAAGSGHLEIVKYLVGQGVSVTATNNYGSTALYVALARNHTDVAGYLKAVVDDGDDDGGDDGDDGDDDGGDGGDDGDDGGDGGDGGSGACYVGQVVRPNQSCGAGGGEFINVGGGCFVYTPFGSGRFCAVKFNINGLRGRRSGNNFTITGLP